MTREEVLGEVARRWPGDSDMQAFVACLLTRLRKTTPMEMMTVEMIRAICPSPGQWTAVWMARLELPRLELVETYFAVHDKDLRTLRPLPVEVWRNVLEGEDVADPRTGEPLTRRDVVMFYRGTEALRQVLE